ncbi:MAG: hypothetical protein ACKVIQ_14900 [Acidimicrobiales bacterium]
MDTTDGERRFEVGGPIHEARYDQRDVQRDPIFFSAIRRSDGLGVLVISFWRSPETRTTTTTAP